ncbi:hypothetical protein F511_26963 [Dorcoceras hygrometricum]|uniref:Initiator tRNA phosphoribosyl transferase family protein n=1 Tax=Dorcoceras hygrometricum TaxID=472368 RepID=A0A2Z7B1J7_9LAMI|nr:hypothetical protein F511_26963 [Dorcoceras hygrometricum]
MEYPQSSGEGPSNSIYKVSRAIKRRDNSLYNALRSIYEDSIFVGEISQLWPELPLLANLRCGLWYSPKFDSNCYFKSTDGHTNNLSFNTSRLNLHVALLSGQRGGCMIVDSTRKGKRFPDSMSKTIPIWTCVLNRAIFKYRMALGGLHASEHDLIGLGQDSAYWDCSLHLPLWVSQAEKVMIEKRLEGWTKELEASGADIASLASSLKKPLRPLWISQKTVIWLNEVPDYDSWDFTPVILVSASSSSGNFQQHTTSEFSWNYIAGAGDDEESWSRGLRPDLFWKHAHDVIRSDPGSCNQKIADIVEKDRVRRAQRGENAPQVSVRSTKLVTEGKFPQERPLDLVSKVVVDNKKLFGEVPLCWLGSTNIAVGRTQLALEVAHGICILDCDKESKVSPKNSGFHLHLPIVDSKYDRFSLLRHLPSALDFSQTQLRKGRKLLVCCQNGEDISICMCLAILTLLYDEAGNFDDGKSFDNSLISKSELRRRLVLICKFAVNARPSRGNIKQVFNYLNERRYGQPPSVL